MDRDLYFMSEAYMAASASKDRRKQVGACIVGPDKEIRSKGYNGFPRGFPDDVDLYHDNPILKAALSVHAEVNAIYNAARMGTSCRDCTMYCTFHPCAPCAQAIVQSGIRELVLHKEFPYSETSWSETQDHARLIFDKCGVSVRWWSGKPLIPCIRTSGRLHCF